MCKALARCACVFTDAAQLAGGTHRKEQQRGGRAHRSLAFGSTDSRALAPSEHNAQTHGCVVQHPIVIFIYVLRRHHRQRRLSVLDVCLTSMQMNGFVGALSRKLCEL